MRHAVTSFALMVIALVLALPAVAQTDGSGGVSIELNKLESREGACRAYLVFNNDTGRTFDKFKLDLVMFDQDDIITRRLAVNAGPLRANKTSVKLFDIEELECASIGRILINDVLDCASAKGERTDCIAEVTPTSKTDTPLVK